MIILSPGLRVSLLELLFFAITVAYSISMKKNPDERLGFY
jgi:hypothetical protein